MYGLWWADGGGAVVQRIDLLLYVYLFCIVYISVCVCAREIYIIEVNTVCVCDTVVCCFKFAGIWNQNATNTDLYYCDYFKMVRFGFLLLLLLWE